MKTPKSIINTLSEFVRTWRRFMAGPLCVLSVRCEEDVVVVVVVVSRREGGVETSKGE